MSLENKTLYINFYTYTTNPYYLCDHSKKDRNNGNMDDAKWLTSEELWLGVNSSWVDKEVKYFKQVKDVFDYCREKYPELKVKVDI